MLDKVVRKSDSSHTYYSDVWIKSIFWAVRYQVDARKISDITSSITCDACKRRIGRVGNRTAWGVIEMSYGKRPDHTHTFN